MTFLLNAERIQQERSLGNDRSDTVTEYQYMIEHWDEIETAFEKAA